MQNHSQTGRSSATCCKYCGKQYKNEKTHPLFVSFATTLDTVTTFRIAIYEDDEHDIDHLRSVISTVATRHHLSTAIDSFQSSKDLQTFLAANDVDLLFLDIALPDDLDGIAVARTIRVSKPDLPIVFVTALPEYALLGYDVQALHYLIKPATETGIETVLARCKQLHHDDVSSATVEVVINRRTVDIPRHRILYAEVRGNRISIHLPDQIMEARTSLNSFLDQCGDAFLRCNRSFIINMNHVTAVRHGEFLLDNDDRIPIRINGRRHTIDQYHNWLANTISDEP